MPTVVRREQQGVRFGPDMDGQVCLDDRHQVRRDGDVAGTGVALGRGHREAVTDAHHGALDADDALAIKGRLISTSSSASWPTRNTKGRRVSGLSIGYAIRNSTKIRRRKRAYRPGVDRVSIVARGVNDRDEGLCAEYGRT